MSYGIQEKRGNIRFGLYKISAETGSTGLSRLCLADLERKKRFVAVIVR